jgi:hypothetical protein
MITTQDKVYQTVLNRVSLLHPGFESMLKDLLGSVIILQTPLPVHSLCRLIRHPEAEVLRLIDGLHAVLYVPDDLAEPLKLHDDSFRTFLLEKRDYRNASLSVEPKQLHGMLAVNCIKIMSECLKQDMSGGDYTETLSPDAARSKVEHFLPFEIKYACVNWVHHVQMSETRIAVDGPAISFLKERLLHWVEAMGWMQRITEAIDMIVSLSSMVHVKLVHPNSVLLIDMLSRHLHVTILVVLKCALICIV